MNLKLLCSYRSLVGLGAVACGLMWVPSALMASDGDAPDLTELLQKADAATRQVRAVSYDVELFGTGTAADRVTRIKGHVDARQERRGLMGAFHLGEAPTQDQARDAFRFRGEFETRGFSRRFDVATDGQKRVRMDFSRNIYAEGGDGAEELVKPFRPLFMLEYFHPTPFSDEINGKSRTYLGIEKVGDVDCHVIDVVYGRQGVDTRWYFGVEDYLPRRVERMVMMGGQATGATVLQLTNLDTAPAFDDETFVPPVPPGFERRAFESMNSKLIAIGVEAPDFTLLSSDGEKIRLSKLRGRVVVLEFWASWCKPCKLVLPHMQAVHERYEGQPVDVFAVNCFEDREMKDPAAELVKNGATYPCLLKGEAVAGRYNVRSLPAIYVIGPDGTVVYARSGYESGFERGMNDAIETALRGAKPPKGKFRFAKEVGG